MATKSQQKTDRWMADFTLELRQRLVENGVTFRDMPIMAGERLSDPVVFEEPDDDSINTQS